MNYIPRLLRPLIGVLGLVITAPLLAEPAAAPQADKKPPARTYIRIQRDKKEQPIALETATVRFIPTAGDGKLAVDLIGVVHVGDQSYYDKLNKQLEQYDVLLYELVAPPGTRIPRGGRRDSDNPIALIQQLAKTVLDLELQTEKIDYTRKNFVHADLSPEQMAEAVRKRGDDGLTLFLSVAADLLRQQNLQEIKGKTPAKKGPDIDLFSLLVDPNASVKLKRVLADQLATLESPEGSLGPTITRILVADRNEAAMKVFQKELAQGKKKIGIFYGAAHMPDFEKRLREDFGLKRADEQWLTAWDLRLHGE